MKNKGQYLVVGTFVLVGIGLIVAILLWFSAASRKNYDIYRVTFNEAVDGVTTNSVVKYNGVEVGKVQKIELDNQDPRNIYVYLDVTQGVNITTATYATIKAQGVTGMSYIALTLTPKTKFTVVQPHNSEPYPEIPAKQSFLTNLTEQAQNISQNIDQVSDQMKNLLDNKNIQHMSSIIANLDKVTSAVASQSSSIASSVGKVGEVLNNVNENTKSLNDAIIQLSVLSKSLQQNSATFDKVMNNVNNNTLRNINGVLLPNVNQTVSNMNQISAQLNELLQTINQNPSALVRGKSTPKAGLGE